MRGDHDDDGLARRTLLKGAVAAGAPYGTQCRARPSASPEGEIRCRPSPRGKFRPPADSPRRAYSGCTMSCNRMCKVSGFPGLSLS